MSVLVDMHGVHELRTKCSVCAYICFKKLILYLCMYNAVKINIKLCINHFIIYLYCLVCQVVHFFLVFLDFPVVLDGPLRVYQGVLVVRRVLVFPVVQAYRIQACPLAQVFLEVHVYLEYQAFQEDQLGICSRNVR